MVTPNILVVGHGMVGHKLAQELAPAAAEGRCSVSVIGEETRPAYDRVHLSEYFSGSSAEDLSLVEPGFFDQRGLQLQSGTAVTAIHRERRMVTLADGRSLPYDQLILATGSYPFVPPIPGKDRQACLVYRTIDDLDAIREAARSARRGVVVGGGLLGLEAAKALKDLGLETHVVEFAPRLMAVQIDEGGGRLLRSKIEALGVAVHTDRNTTEIIEGADYAHRMNFADGEHLETDLIVFSAGIRPRDDLARAAELAVGPRGGIVVDDLCRTSDPDIFAVGECALWNDQVFGLVAPGYRMAEVAAAQITATFAGETSEARFTGADMSTKLKLLGVDVASVGDAHARTAGAQCYTLMDEPRGIYKKLVVSANSKHLLGGVLVGDAEDFSTWQQYMLNAIKLPEKPESLLLPAGTGDAPSLGAEVLPDSATICSCNNVSKGALIEAIDGGCTQLGELKAQTRAGSTCGGCAQLCGQILKSELQARGVAVNNHVCEHFPHSRQELYHLVRVERIESFGSLLKKHGTGRGCDICKPLVASILASCWNEFVLAKDKAGLQDSNDHFLANIQKDGSYSVVPRIPGGEITPDKLIVIGEVAKKYGLYTKITGGQRIDLFGAQVHQLPDIWKELVDAGFESGHAYGKAVRTVKSCVGSTWCRYGVQDSVSMAIQVEERYRGIRSPHKIKMAVSGCTRECAEAQSKDIGVIATEKGWNLYVGGNGGMRPRHANLFATDLDDEGLIRAIDRVLMFYIRTADRLQRTSVWVENLEGGIEYLQQVVLEDALGIGAELDREMAELVQTYACEWKKTLDNPGTVRRFRTFVNSDKADQRIHFIKERGQIRPARSDERPQETA